MTNRREVLLGVGGTIAAALLPYGGDDMKPVSYTDAESVRPFNVTGHGRGDEADVLGLEHVTGFGKLEIDAGGQGTTLRVDVETTSAVSVRAEGDVSRAELVALREQIDAALSEA